MRNFRGSGTYGKIDYMETIKQYKAKREFDDYRFPKKKQSPSVASKKLLVNIGGGTMLAVLLSITPETSFSSSCVDKDCINIKMGYTYDVNKNISKNAATSIATLSLPRLVEIEEYACSSIYLDDKTRYNSLLKSLQDNVLSKKVRNEMPDFTQLFKRLAQLLFVDDIVQYDSYEDTIDITFWFNHGLSVLINKDVEDETENVIFSLYHKKKLLVCDEMPIGNLVNTIQQTIEMVDSKYD